MKIEQKFNNGRGAFLCPWCDNTFASGWSLKETQYECRNNHKFEVKLVLESFYEAEKIECPSVYASTS